ncbi:MarR family winged helix-turn-helix transcriptional regulator [Martelella endophytica]|uniref:MarR family transcriptional regulator n=1 Tax=Martelella endophytica TaxID=1486262 RepID=A0A0D5LLR8_MAREN|nr:MarR family winged helix-turn-helix transcriptional regulator [Martelella endophytica]AJY44717.1 MarR family transcriptional regulator [Martelella endophytica]
MNTSQDDTELNQAIERLSAAMTRNRLMTRRRIIARIAIANIAPALEITHLDVLDVVRRLEGKGSATIGAVAEGMRIDPSRASRIVAELVSNDVLERRICQSDARRSILVITPKGRSLVDEMRAVKRSLLDTVTESWEPEELIVFSKLYDRFITGLEDYARAFNAGEGRAEDEEEAGKERA